eukprot:360074-Rhodomonas_salina.2
MKCSTTQHAPAPSFPRFRAPARACLNGRVGPHARSENAERRPHASDGAHARSAQQGKADVFELSGCHQPLQRACR